MRKRNSYSRIIQELEAWQQLSKGAKIRLFQHCVENDITSFLINYTRPESYDKELGTALSESQLSRDKIQLIANLGAKKVDQVGIISEVEEILRILKTDYLDLIFVKGENSSEEINSGLEQLKAQGKIKEIGLYKLQTKQQTEWNFPFSCSATLASLSFNRGTMKSMTLKKPNPEEIAEMLFLESTGEENFSDGLKEMSLKYNLLPKELLFSWILEHPAHFHPIIKANDEAGIDSAAKAYHKKLIKEDWLKLTDKI